jgi:hypothetical protein
MSGRIVELDVRETLRAKQEPFPLFMDHEVSGMTFSMKTKQSSLSRSIADLRSRV